MKKIILTALVITAMLLAGCTQSSCANGHTESDWIIDKQATYTEKGQRHTECTVCGKTIRTEEINKLDEDVHVHTESDWIIDKEATYTKKGLKHTVCETCGEVLQTEEIATIACTKEYTTSISEAISIVEQTGIATGSNALWGNHESRVVHTTHGDYAAYCIDEIASEDSELKLTGYAIFKINEDGSVVSLIEDYRARESSGVTIFTDKNENVWLVEIGDNRIKETGRKSAVHVTAVRVDADTDEVVSYSAIYNVPQYGTGFGYGAAAYDPYSNKIIAQTADGDPHYGGNSGTIEWFLFDCEKLYWEADYKLIYVDNRYCYPFVMPDGKGGMYILMNRDYRCTSAGYPEIGDHNTGVDWKDKNGLAFKYRAYNQDAGWVWDAINMFYIPDINKAEFTNLWIAEADYSYVENQTEEERYSIEGRMKNWYPNFQMNNGGDAYIDSEGYLHVIWCKQYVFAALTRADADNMFYHDVYDIRNVTSAEDLTTACLISRSPIKNAVTENKSFSFRLYEDEDGNLFYISARSDRVKKDETLKIKSSIDSTTVIDIYALEGTPETGYTFELIDSKAISGHSIINISNRGSQIIDGHVGAIIGNGKDYNYYEINIKTEYKE